MSPRRRDSTPGPTAAAALAESLRERILEGDPAPGTALREEELAQAHDLSRHTVRAALAMLGAERLVEVVPYRGARVATLDDAALIALQQLRAALETEAVRLLGDTHPSGWPIEVRAPIDAAIDALAAAEGSADWSATTRAHAGVHRAIVAAADSPRIAEAHAHLEAEILLLLAQVRPDYPPGGLTAEHRSYVDALGREGGAAVREHLAHSTALIRAARAKNTN
ncbi:DNA-binding transcriptional regulator, GntR family [Agreia bicolorata]|uniref:DNA-binding transcriptional regulator, GntR family n=1 Tax=Agreia bicolorata TaxID=110935 RepID=A0A1T4XNM0_9MICO|nr:GntR family transcriptional regulator [Agreia bicolorata]SKA90711.1 DNA-binding transcriptional regulator, GntR family [Agreia bicolorata]